MIIPGVVASGYSVSGGGGGSAGHRYWRISITGRENSVYTVIGELEFRDVVGGTSIATGGSPSASSALSTHEATKAFDGDLATYWEGSSNLPCWVQYDFGNPVAIVEAAITQQAHSDRDPTAADFQYSDDGATWVTVYSYSGQQWAYGETKVFTF